MSKKAAMMISLGVIISFTLVVLSFIGIYKFLPEYWNPDALHTSDSIEVDTIVTETFILTTREKIDEFLTTSTERDYLQIQKDSIIEISQLHLDSIRKIDDELKEILDSLKNVQAKLGKTKKNSKSLKDSISKLERDYKKTEGLLKTANETIEKQKEQFSSKKDSSKEARLDGYVKMFETVNPKKASGIVETLTPSEAAYILKKMKTKKAGKILDELPPEVVAKIISSGSKDN